MILLFIAYDLLCAMSPCIILMLHNHIQMSDKEGDCVPTGKELNRMQNLFTTFCLLRMKTR